MKHSRNYVYQTAYHIVWIPKYRRKILVGDVREFTIKTLHQIAEDKGFEILALEVCPDHIHLFVSIPPAVSISQAVKCFS
ncbi:IS200/IS605 family transposase [Anoxybacter fermentans]|uniref:IS200/IS605 family transposase n=1 Tax=Anoxybacter fermentans TaxID=1323375 RepID=UPI003AB86BB8